MSASIPPTRLPRFLFQFVLGLAGFLAGLVFLCPLLDQGAARPHGFHRMVALFARDSTVRQTTVASAIGLAVTALVFFRPAGAAPAPVPRQPRLPQPPSNVVGA